MIQRIVGFERGFEAWPIATPPTYHRADRWAKGVAPKRKVIPVSDKAHAAVRTKIGKPSFLPDLHKAVFYDWASGRVVRRKKPLDDRELCANLLAGYPPGSDECVARILALLDSKAKQRKVAAYCNHLYADLQARVFEGVTIYEAWYGGATLDIPDVDAIPFAIRILRNTSFKSPIPKSPRRTRLYKRIRDHYFAYRKHRTLREAAAAAFVSAEPQLEGDYARLVPRFHYLYAIEEEDCDKVAKRLRSFNDREAFLRWADRNVANERKAYEERERRQRDLAAMRVKIRRLMLATIERAEG